MDDASSGHAAMLLALALRDGLSCRFRYAPDDRDGGRLYLQLGDVRSMVTWAVPAAGAETLAASIDAVAAMALDNHRTLALPPAPIGVGQTFAPPPRRRLAFRLGRGAA